MSESNFLTYPFFLFLISIPDVDFNHTSLKVDLVLTTST